MTQINSPSQKLRRGDTSAGHVGLVFFRYKGSKEVWVTPKQFEQSRTLKKAVQAKQRAKPEHKEKMRNYLRDYLKKPEQKARMSTYYKQPEVRARYKKKWAMDPELRQRRKEYDQSPAGRATQKKSRENRKEAIRDYFREYRKIWLAIPTNRIATNCRSRMRDAVKCQGVRKFSKAKDLLGCTFEFFRGWLESKFERGMSWVNYGVFWEIDHIRPVASYDLSQEDQQRACFHYSNCQPLWSDLNRSKSDKIITN